MIFLVSGNAFGVGDDAYIAACEQTMAELEYQYPELEEWLKENMDGKYSIEENYEQSYFDAVCKLFLCFELETDEMAFKLRWM